MKKILITGAAGLVGQKITVHADRLKIPFLATSRTLTAESKNAAGTGTFCPLDVTDRQKVEETIAAYRPEVIIHSAAMTQVDLCEKDRDLCDAINVEGTRNIVRAAEKCRAHLVHLSTDFIFDGESGPYGEEAIPHPINYYGETKLEAERIVSSMEGSWSIARTILVYGFNPRLSRSNIVLFVKNRLARQEPVRIVTDQIRTPTLAEDLAEACITIGQKKLPGIYHLSGPELVTIYAFALKIAQIFELNPQLIQPVLTEALNEPARRPLRSGFMIEKARKDFGYQPHSLEDGLRLVRQQTLLYNDAHPTEA